MTGLIADRVTIRRGGLDILSDASLSLGAGELVVVVGPNGAGKSTLLNALAGDIAPTQGEVRLQQRPLGDYPLDDLAALRAVVGQPPRLAFDYSVRDVVALAWRPGNGRGPDTFQAALADTLERCELSDLANRRYMTLSSGERQRAEFARALLQLWRPETDRTPRWLLLDEPTANLDVAHGVNLLDALQTCARAGDGVLAVLHDLDLAARFADRIALLADGELVAVGAPEVVLTAERLSAIYGTSIHVEQHETLARLVVIG